MKRLLCINLMTAKQKPLKLKSGLNLQLNVSI